MISVQLKNRLARAIILEEPSNGKVSGVVECADCAWRSYITSENPEEQAAEIEKFILGHRCGYVPKSHRIIVGSIDELKVALEKREEQT